MLPAFITLNLMLWSSFGLSGHIYPLKPLNAWLKAKNVPITYVSIDDVLSIIGITGIRIQNGHTLEDHYQINLDFPLEIAPLKPDTHHVANATILTTTLIAVLLNRGDRKSLKRIERAIDVEAEPTVQILDQDLIRRMDTGT